MTAAHGSDLSERLLPEDTYAEFKEAYARYDLNGDGKLSQSEIGRVFESMGERITTAELKTFFEQVDKNNSDFISLQEFIGFAPAFIAFRAKAADKHEVVSSGKLAKSDSKRKAMAAVSMITAYAAVGISYGFIRRGWTLVDSMYFVVITLTTVGYGDMSFAGTWEDRVFGGFFVFVGVAFIGSAVGFILAGVQERLENKFSSMSTAFQAQAVGDGCVSFQLDDELRKLHTRCRNMILCVVVTVLAGTIVMAYLDDKCFSEAFYWASVTMTTVGYGDVLPTSDASKLFTIFYVFLSFGVIASAISFLGSIPFEARRLKNIAKVLQQFGESLEPKELEALCSSEEIRSVRTDGMNQSTEAPHVTCGEFILWQLLKQEKIGMEDVRPCLAMFDKLDKDKSGWLNEDDIHAFVETSLLQGSAP
mmetsp:Transcript_112713/g.318519  ORF Transcript_112713/g.318519 Transcript_112713/m.318519 type:complete len:420 (-) Transcript_112713:164-1423(-)